MYSLRRYNIHPSSKYKVLCRPKQTLIDTFQKLKQEPEKNGLTINQNKKKYMRHSRTQINWKDKELEIEGMKTEEVSKTKYLGTTD